MPYIPKLDRRFCYAPDPNTSVGHLNYMITQCVLGWLRSCGAHTNYAAYNSVVGALECAKLEVYRRMVAVYEDHKCRENGDVYPDVVGGSLSWPK